MKVLKEHKDLEFKAECTSCKSELIYNYSDLGYYEKHLSKDDEAYSDKTNKIYGWIPNQFTFATSLFGIKNGNIIKKYVDEFIESETKPIKDKVWTMYEEMQSQNKNLLENIYLQKYIVCPICGKVIDIKDMEKYISKEINI